MTSGNTSEDRSKYEFIRPLGRGGMGEVYLAQDTRLGRKVAIKHLRGDLPGGDWEQRLRQEARLLAQLSHPNVVQIYDIIEHEDGLALVMEYIEGRSLHIVLRERQVDTVQRLRWLSEIAAGLAASHDAGITHHDLKAENVLIGKDNTAKVTDFGIAEAERDFAGDMLALGLLAQEMLDADPALSPRVRYLLDQLSDKAPHKRPQSGEAARELRQAWHEQTQRETPLPGDLEAPAKNRPAAVIARPVAISLVLLAALASAIYFFWPSAQREFVAITPTVIADNSPLTARQQLNLRATIEQALRQSVIDSAGLALISSGETLQLKGTRAEQAAALGVDSLLSSTLVCDETSCELSIERLGGEHAAVIAQRSVGILTDSPLETHDAVQRQWPHLFPGERSLASATDVISADDYRNYLRLHQAYIRSSLPLQNILSDIEDILGRADRFLPLYRLYTDVSLLNYEDMGDTIYLDRLEDILTRAENWAGGTFFLQRNWFLLALQRRDFARAEAIIDELSASGEDDFLLEEMSGQLYYAMAEYDKAEAHYARAVVLRPGIDSYYARARNLFYLGRHDEAMESLEALLELYPYHTQGLGIKGLILLEAGKFGPAVDAFQQSLVILPENSLQRSNLGLAYMLQGEYELAKEQFLVSYSRGSRDAVLVINLADTESLLGNTDRAIELYQSLLDRYQVEENQMDLFAVSQAFAQLQMYEEALAVLKYIEIHSGNGAETSFNAALVYALAGQNISALVEIDRALSAGISGVWFTLPWFDRLCTEPRFPALLEDAGVPAPCPSN